MEVVSMRLIGDEPQVRKLISRMQEAGFHVTHNGRVKPSDQGGVLAYTQVVMNSRLGSGGVDDS